MSAAPRRVRVHLAKENMKFSAGHFTIFGPGERERLHGHNFTVQAIIETDVGEDGICFDYGVYKDRIVALCRELNEWFILPAHSPHLRIEDSGEHIVAHFGEERIPFLRGDVKVLPIANGTLEEFSAWFLQRLTEDREELRRFRIHWMEVRTASGPGQHVAVSASFESPAD